MLSCARVYWIFHFISRSFHPRLCFIAFKMKSNYPVPSHFQFSGRDGSGRVLEKKFGTGRVPGSRRTLPTLPPQCAIQSSLKVWWISENPRPFRPKVIIYIVLIKQLLLWRGLKPTEVSGKVRTVSVRMKSYLLHTNH